MGIENIAAYNDFTARVLMSLVEDLAVLVQTTERLRIQIEVLAKEHGIPVPAGR